MEWLEKLLQKINVQFDANLLKAENAQVHNTVNITHGPKNEPTITRHPNGRVELNLANLSPEQIAAAQCMLKELLAKQDHTMVDTDRGQDILELKEEEAAGENRDILGTLQPFISPEDYLALRSALLLRSRFRAGHDVQDLKTRIVQSFGPRGAKIANLCTAGYFESHIIPTLERMRQREDFSPKKFARLFNLIVEESAFAIFIQHATSTRKTEELIADRIRTNACYGLNHVVIHGIGPDNIRKIREAVDSILKAHSEISRTSEQQAGDSIHVYLEFPPDICARLGHKKKPQP